MNYIVTGEGERAIVFLHGWGGNKYSLLKIAMALAGGQKCVLIDFPPFGETAEPREVWGIEDYSSYVMDILEKLKIKKFSIISHSFGGRVAIFISNKYNERVERLVLVDSAGLLPKMTALRRLRLWRNRRRKRKGKCVRGSKDYEALSSHMKKVFVKIVNEDLKSLLGGIVAKTLILWGEKDRETPLYMAKELHKGIKGSKLIIYRGCGHFCYSETEKVIGDIKDFLGEM